MSFLELHDASGSVPRGQKVQFDKSPSSILEDFSAENGPTSWTEDNVSVFRSDRCVVRRGVVSYNRIAQSRTSMRYSRAMAHSLRSAAVESASAGVHFFVAAPVIAATPNETAGRLRVPTVYLSTRLSLQVRGSTPSLIAITTGSPILTT
jgi:hypothetical protein